MNTLPYQPDIAARMQADGTERIPATATFYHTTNDYWIAWHDDVAAVLSPHTPENVPCDWVEGAHDLAEVVELIESGDYAQAEEFDGDDAAWAALVDEFDESDGHHHPHQH